MTSSARHRTILDFLITVFIPLFAGGLIYYLTRPHSIYFLSWIDTAVGHSEGSPVHWPSWMVYQLPCALWTYSFTSLLLIIWKRVINRRSFLWILFPVTLAIFLECCTGIYDAKDLLAIVVGFVAAMFLHPFNTINLHSKTTHHAVKQETP
ncbi:MAG: hypothetical protein ACKVOK_11430 [Flavobacteriales bacterium]